jgi:hypothetical protein
MLRIKLYELDKHRNETTFRPFLFHTELFREIGVEFVTDGSCDFSFVGQASIIDKKKSLSESVENGLSFISKIKEPYFIFDGQDSATMIGVYEVASRSNPIYVFKSTLYKNKNDYLRKTINGRTYWGEGNYSLPSLDIFEKVKLSHFNWLSTLQPDWIDYNEHKQYDVSLLLGRRDSDNFEHGVNQSPPYNEHRNCLFNTVSNSFNSVRLNPGQRLNRDEYLNTMYNCKIILSPFGFGEITPRDLEAAMFGCVLIKPDMSHIETLPNVYIPYETYVPCKHDFSDINEKIEYVLSDYKNIQKTYTENFKRKYVEEYNPYKLVLYYYNIFKNLKGVSTE